MAKKKGEGGGDTPLSPSPKLEKNADDKVRNGILLTFAGSVGSHPRHPSCLLLL